MTKRTVIIGVGGPVGSGKTLLLERLTRRMSDLNLAVITNDIYTKEDALSAVSGISFCGKYSIILKIGYKNSTSRIISFRISQKWT